MAPPTPGCLSLHNTSKPDGRLNADAFASKEVGAQATCLARRVADITRVSAIGSGAVAAGMGGKPTITQNQASCGSGPDIKCTDDMQQPIL